MIICNEKVLFVAMSLPLDTRALLAGKLLHSLYYPGREEIDRLWAEEVERRVRLIETGEAKPSCLYSVCRSGVGE